MPPEDVNKTVLRAVIHFIESWVEEDRAVASLANGLSTRMERDRAVTDARAKKESAAELLNECLPATAYANLFAGLGAAAPGPKTPLGAAARQWGEPDRRLDTARELLKTAAAAQRRAEVHAEAARRAAGDAAERIAAEEARRLAEEEAEVRRLAERAAALTRHRREVQEVFVDDFLAADDWFDAWDNAQRVSRDDFDYWKAEFVQAWARRVLKEDKLDLKQARAVASTSQDLRL